MPGTPTPILGLIVPNVFGDDGIWANELNSDLGVLDGLGAVSIVNISSNNGAVLGVFPETVVRVTTGSAVVTFTLLAPGPSNTGRIWTVKKVDAGVGSARIVVAGGALIDGQSSWVRANQGLYTSFLSNGAGGYDVIGGN
jgi:hypothetical protein